MTIKQEFTKIVDKDLLMAFDGKSLYPSAMVDDESYYPRIETRYLFTPDKEFLQQLNNRTSTQFKDQASVILRVRYYNPKNLCFNIYLLGKMLFYMERDIKMLIDYEMDKQLKF